MKSCDVQNVTRDLFLLTLCINRRENHLIAAGLHSALIVKDQTERVRKKGGALLAAENVSLRQTVAEATGEKKITLRSARRMEATAVNSSHSWGNRCALSERFPIMSLRERAKARRSPLCCARLLFFQLLYLTLFSLKKKNGITLDRAFGSALLRAFLRLSSPPGPSHPRPPSLSSPFCSAPLPSC